MYQEHENIKKYDWRLQAVTTLRGDQNVLGNFYKDGTPVIASGFFNLRGTQISFLLPSMTAIFLDFGNKLYLESEGFLVFKNFEKLNNHFSVKDMNLLIEFLQKRIGNVIYSFLALESFMNESLKDDYLFDNSLGTIKTRKTTPKILNKEVIEKDITTVSKFTYILPDIYSVPNLDNGILQKFEKLKILRDRITHLKEIDKRNFDINDDTIWKNLLDVNFLNYAVIVKDIITYFYSFGSEENIPRWLSKNKF